ncbi:hypothetical protein OPIT5_06410 [Opitutaceae bacterium TAV5]|nr:hypothetical protein OPIT5_06410 [Opitutaceae bacterium TAV5]
MALVKYRECDAIILAARAGPPPSLTEGQRFNKSLGTSRMNFPAIMANSAMTN